MTEPTFFPDPPLPEPADTDDGDPLDPETAVPIHPDRNEDPAGPM